MDKLTELSKEISYALRHAPWEYELEMDEEGWVPVEQLLDALHKEEKWRNISENDLVIMIQESEVVEIVLGLVTQVVQDQYMTI